MATVCEVDLARIVEYLTGQLGEDERTSLEAHIGAGCAQCAERIIALGGMVSEPEPEPAQQMLVHPLMDTQMPQPAGVRGAAVLSRRRVYEAESKICIDIQQNETEPGISTIEGQILIKGGDLDEAAGASVSLSDAGNPVAKGQVDEIGDFSIVGVPAGIYDVTITIGSMEAMIKGIEV
ncbi:MAG: hypothetical protein QF878_11320 [SAR202 cluster bacterium]|nr:hypothetical protein [SAR202 cluster bacterium]